MNDQATSFRHSLGARTLLFAVLPTVAIMLGIIVYTSVSLSSRLRDEAERSLERLAQKVAAEVERSNTRAVLAAEIMTDAQEAGGLFGQREASVALARQILSQHPDFTGVYFGYEPNADGQDDLWRRRRETSPIGAAHDDNGRFLPYWFRGKQDTRQILLEPLVDMETSLYYQGVKELYRQRGDGHSMVTEPYVYEGKMIVEQTHPIVMDGRFVGIAGIDRALTEITAFVKDLKRRTGVDIFLISRAGRFIATTTREERELITHDVASTAYAGLFGPFLEDRQRAFFTLDTDPASGELSYYATALVPTGTWTVVVRKPERVVAAPIRHNLWANLVIAGLGLVAVIGLSLWTTHSVTGRLQRAVAAADTVASGNLAAHVHLEDGGADEVARLMSSLRRMVQSLEHKMRVIDAIAHGETSRHVEVMGDGDALGRSLQEMTESLHRIVEHTARIAEGDYSQLLEPRSPADELVHSLNRMTKALADAHDRLEQRVRQRTDELKDYAERLEARSADLQALTEASQTRARQEASLAALTTRLQGNLSVEVVAQGALDEIVDFLGIPAGALYVLESDGQLYRRAGHALPPEADAAPTFRLGTGTIGQVAASRQASIWRPEPGSWSISFGLMRLGPHQVQTLPLVASGMLVGVVELYLMDELEQAQAEWLDKACGLAAVSLRLARESREREVAEEQTRQILESSGEGLFGLDIEGRATFVNPAACELLGYRADELIGQVTHDLIHHAHADGSPYPVEDCPMREAFTRGVTTRVDDEVLWHRDGHPIPVEYTATPIRKDGALLGAVISFRDVSERRQTEARLRSREAQFRNLLDSAPDAMVISDAEGLITMVNRQTETLFGWRREELIGQPVEVLMPERFRSGHPDKRQGFMANHSSRPMGAGLALCAVTREGREFPIEVSLSPIETDEGLMVASALRDVSERVEAEREIRLNQERLAALFEALPVGVMMIDAEGKITQANGLAASILGIDVEDEDLRIEAQRIVREDGSPLPIQDHPASRALAGEAVRGQVLGVHQPDGDLVWISASAATIGTGAGGGVVVAFEDIAERRRAEAERRQRERREQLMGRFREAVWKLDTTSDVRDLAAALVQIIDAAGMAYDAIGINIVESEAEGQVRAIGTGKDGFNDHLLEPQHAEKVLHFWRQGEIANRRDLQAEDEFGELRDWDMPGAPRSIIDIPFSHGTLAANSAAADAFTPHLDLLVEITRVLSEGFRRLDDLRLLRDRS